MKVIKFTVNEEKWVASVYTRIFKQSLLAWKAGGWDDYKQSEKAIKCISIKTLKLFSMIL